MKLELCNFIIWNYATLKLKLLGKPVNMECGLAILNIYCI